MYTIGERVKIQRQKMKYTQKQLAKMIEMSQANISEIEKNTVNPTAKIIGKISIALETTTEWLIFGTETIREISEDEKILLNEYRLLTEGEKGEIRGTIKQMNKGKQQEEIGKEIS